VTGAGFPVIGDIEDLAVEILWSSQILPALNQPANQPPNQPGTPRDANESIALTQLHAIQEAEHMYAKIYRNGFTKNLDSLGPPPAWYHATKDRAGLFSTTGTPFQDIDASHFTQNGYRFAYTAGDTDADGKVAHYTVTARPLRFGVTGTRSFYVDEDGVVRETNGDGPATKTDPAVKQ